MTCSRESGSEDAKCVHCHCGTMMGKLYWERFVPLHFCQILLPGRGFHNRIEIPKKFAKNSRVRLHPEVTLRGPGGATWHAITNTTGDKVFLSDGWEEFARAYSLQDGNILIFKYDGICVFDVLIFDGDSLCEKEAAYFVHKCEKEADPKRKRISTEVDVDEHVDVPTHRATKKARKEVCKRKVPRMSKFSRLFFNHWRKKRAHFKFFPAKKTKTVRQNTSVNASYRNDEEPKNTETYGKIETETAPPSGNDVHCTFLTEPFQDVAVIHSGGWIGEDEIPAEDTCQINETINGFTDFETETAPPSGNDVHRTFSTEPLQDVAVIHGGGWISEDAKDTCQVNETINVDASPLAGKEVDEGPSKEAACSERRLTRQQLVTKGNPSGSTDSSDRNSLSGKDALEMARDQATESNFIVTMRPSAVQRRFIVSIPTPWYKKHVSPKIINALLRVGDKTWPVRVSHRTNEARGSITTGWECFARENWLSEQDVCLFNLTSLKGDTVTLDVSIFRARPNTLEETETKVDEYSSTI